MTRRTTSTKTSQLQAKVDPAKLTAEYTGRVSRAGIDTSGPQLLSCAAILYASQEAATASLPHVLQLNWAHLEQPGLGSNVCERSGERLFFQTMVRDFSGAVPIAVAEPAALCLSNCENMAELVQRHGGGSIVFYAIL